MKTFSSEEIILRLKNILGIESDKELGELLGVTKGAISNWKKRNSIDWNLVFSKCEHVDLNWLINGYDGRDVVASTKHDTETKPRIPFDAAAGALSIITNSVAANQCEYAPVIPRFPKYDFTIMVRGNSMEPEFMSGDEIACRLIDEKAFIQWGRPHVIDTTQGVVLKRIYDRKSSILCRSDNDDYEDFEIPKSDVLHLALVVGSLRVY